MEKGRGTVKGGGMTPDLVTIRRFAELTGYTEGAVRAKIEKGVWVEGYQWVRGPDGRILMSIEGFDRWGVGRGSEPLAGVYRSTSATRGRGAGRDLG